jgi:hypothetical protein
MASSRAMPRSVLPALACLGALAAACAASAADLPPKEAPAFTAVYHQQSKARDRAADEWNDTVDDTVTIAVLTKQSRWDHKSDGSTEINDSVSRYTTKWGGKTPPGTALRTRVPFVPINWELGWTTVAYATGKDPEVLGETTIAGRPCTRLKFVSDQYGEPEFCVAKNGIVLRFANASSTAGVVYEATSVDDKAPDASKFVVPAGINVEERAAGPKKTLPF